jgi:hypothetical protein
MIYGTKLLDTDIELFTAALSKACVYVWAMDPQGVYYQVNTGVVEEYSPDYVKLRSHQHPRKSHIYSRECYEFSINF